jgi:hypothetical protein
MLLVSWWLMLRWLSRPLPPWPAVVLAWLLLGAIAVSTIRRRLARRVPTSELLLRVPGAAFFFVLLALYGRDLPSLCLYAVAFAPPYLALLLG